MVLPPTVRLLASTLLYCSANDRTYWSLSRAPSTTEAGAWSRNSKLVLCAGSTVTVTLTPADPAVEAAKIVTWNRPVWVGVPTM
jgi:hypothetical protein